MSHSLCCRLSAAVVVILSLVALAPAAHARPFASGETALTGDLSWFDAALSWLQSLLPGGERTLGRLTGTVSQAGKKVTDPPGGGLIIVVVPNTGSCIDPQGNPRPWCQY